MNIQNIKRIVLDIYSAYRRNKTYLKYKKNITMKRLTKSQRKEIKKYYKDNFGVSVTTRDHELLYSICDVYKKEFMPFAVYGKLLERLSPYSYKKILDDKALYDWLFPNVKFPERVVSCCNGVTYCYDSESIRRESGEEEIFNCVSNLKECIIKPSISSSAGIGVKCFSTVRGGGRRSWYTYKRVT